MDLGMRQKALEQVIELLMSLKDESSDPKAEEKVESPEGESAELPEGKAKIDILAIGKDSKDKEMC